MNENHKDWGFTKQEKETIKYIEEKISKIQSDFSEIFVIYSKYKNYIYELYENEKKTFSRVVNRARSMQNELDNLLFRIEACLKNQKFKKIMKLEELGVPKQGHQNKLNKDRISLEEDEKYNEQHNIN